ncbi:unnamed protein product [Amoebophrya sp. A25]|nr:unnamed protein product [Amoebophrya sp. A25]|eukprot:GSA25T00010252001.1
MHDIERRPLHTHIEARSTTDKDTSCSIVTTKCKIMNPSLPVCIAIKKCATMHD